MGDPLFIMAESLWVKTGLKVLQPTFLNIS